MNTDPGHRNVLIVEDDDVLRSVLAEDLRAKGITVYTAQNSAEAFQILSTTPIALAVSDISMPGKNGLELLSQVRASGMDMPFAFLTGYDSKDLMLTAIRLGASDFIQKPFSAQELIQMVFRNAEIGKLKHDLESLMLRNIGKLPDGGKIIAEIQYLKKQVALLQVANCKLR